MARRLVPQSRWLTLVVISLLAGAVGCGITVGRRFGKATMNKVIYDDRCGLQEYWDRVAMGIVRLPQQVSSSEVEKTEGKRANGGKSSFAFTSDGQLAVLRRVLSDNWRRVPEEVMTADQVEVEVRWSERAETKFVVMSEDAELRVGRESYTLPYHHCLSALLFGESLYGMRRQMVGLSPVPSFDKPAPDAGVARDALESE